MYTHTDHEPDGIDHVVLALSQIASSACEKVRYQSGEDARRNVAPNHKSCTSLSTSSDTSPSTAVLGRAQQESLQFSDFAAFCKHHVRHSIASFHLLSRRINDVKLTTRRRLTNVSPRAPSDLTFLTAQTQKSLYSPNFMQPLSL